jgi:predicted ArsR family transcriptional regulator
LGLVVRSRASEGRGRPSHQYSLTEKGRKSLANNLGDLAVVLWEEVQKINDEDTRRRVISGAVERLAEKYETEIHGATMEDRMASVTEMFAERSLPVSFEHENGLPVIKVSGCPYPTLARDNREICDMEQELLGRILGQPVDRCQCQQDGDQCCSFQTAIGKAEA